MKHLILFTTPYCEPCKAFKPLFLDTVKNRLDISYAVMDATVEEELRVKYKVRTVPVLIMVEDGVKVGEKIHPSTEGDVIDLIEGEE